MAMPVTLIRAKFLALKPVMDERLTRLWAGAEAEAIGDGGIALVAAATGMSRTTIRAGRDELRKGVAARDVVKVRRAGAGRPSIEKRKPEIIDALDHLMEPAARDDRESPLRWTSKSTRKLSAELDQRGFAISPQKVAQLLHAVGYRLQGVDRPIEGASLALRGQQLELIHQRVQAFQARGVPVIAVDSRTRQLAPPEHDATAWWRENAPVAAHDPRDRGPDPPGAPRSEVARDASWVDAEVDPDAPGFAVRALADWWEHTARRTCGDATELLVIAEAGTGAPARRWKTELQGLADRTGLTLAVSHFPPCTSKWTRIEHRVIYRVTESAGGLPRGSARETVVQRIGGFRPAAGPGALSPLDTRGLPAEWNYPLHPRRDRW
jgi:hypothetical protein